MSHIDVITYERNRQKNELTQMLSAAVYINNPHEYVRVTRLDHDFINYCII